MALTTSDSRQAGGLIRSLEQSDATGCESDNRPYLMRLDKAKKTVYFIQPPCGLWSCKSCAENRKRLWFKNATYGADVLLDGGAELTFVTLTSHRLVRSAVAGIKVWRKAWPKLSARWRRASPGLQYLYIPEHGKLGHFHCHLITTARLPTRWYKDNGAQTGLGYQAKAEPILRAIECGAYMVKYITKSLAYGEYPKYFRRVNTSRKWPKLPVYQSPYEWRMIGTDGYIYDCLYARYANSGWRIRDNVCYRG